MAYGTILKYNNNIKIESKTIRSTSTTRQATHLHVDSNGPRLGTLDGLRLLRLDSDHLTKQNRINMLLNIVNRIKKDGQKKLNK